MEGLISISIFQFQNTLFVPKGQFVKYIQEQVLCNILPVICVCRTE